MSSIDARRSKRRANLKRLLQPRHVAFIGGRQAEASITLCQEAGFAGEIWPVNPNYASLAGIPCFASIEALPQAPDAALVAVGRARSVEVVRERARTGAGGAVCIAGGFAEAGEEGEALQRSLVGAAADLALVGPNCLGVLNFFDRVAVWGTDNHFQPLAGPGAAMVSQSGYIVYTVTNVEQAFPLGYAISIGNQANMDAGDFVDVLLDDERVHSIGLYLEGMVDVAALSRAAMRALEKGVPLFALKGGGTGESAALAVSHTGTLAVANDLWTALFERLGIVEVPTPKALVETLKMTASGRLPAGRRMVAVSYSGGYSSLLVERGMRLGFVFPVPTAAQRRVIEAHLPDFAATAIANPLDLNLTWQSVTSLDAIEESLFSLAGGCDLLVFFIDYPRRKRDFADIWKPTLDAMVGVRSRTGTACAVGSVLPDGLPVELRERLASAGVPALQGADDALCALSSAVRYTEQRHSILISGDAPCERWLPDAGAVAGVLRLLDEHAAKQRLASYGLGVPPGAVAAPDAVARVATALGFPVVLKVLSEHLAHKSRTGAVKLGLDSAQAVEAAREEIRDALARHEPSLGVDQFLVERMIDDVAAELIVGIKRDAALGLALIVGSGGVEVETLRDYQTVLLPVSNAALLTALGRLRVLRRLRLEGAALDALLGAVRAVADFAEAERDALIELDVNPLILRRTGEAVAVDALVRLASS